MKRKKSPRLIEQHTPNQEHQRASPDQITPFAASVIDHGMTGPADLTGRPGDIQLDTISDLGGRSMGCTSFGVSRQDPAFFALVTIGFGAVLMETVGDKGI